MAGNRKRAFVWRRRAAANKNGGDLLKLGYCYQYGNGVRRDQQAACLAYRAAIRSQWICDYSREEARLAIAYLDRGVGQRARRSAISLLREAAADGDYPQAADLLSRLEDGEPLPMLCRCRRGLSRSFAGQAQCPVHA
jgi:TPR repeat protein